MKIMRNTQLIFLFSCIFGIIICQDQDHDEDEDDGKYVPDTIPVWEHERQDYTFSYGVKDLNTGDVKNQWEKKVGDTVHGHYTVLEPDGSLRIVHYTADEKNGFNAVVKHEGPSYHPVTTTASIPSSHFVSVAHNQNQPHHDYKLPQRPEKVKFQTHNLKEHQLKTSPQDGETEAIDAFLYIPAGHQDEDFEIKYELVPVQQEIPENHKPIYTPTTPPQKRQKPKIKATTAGYNILNPVTIDLTQYDFTDYHLGNNVRFNRPEIETGFKPLNKHKYSEPVHVNYGLPNVPNTFTTNKKPITTPGLKTFASDNSNMHTNPRGEGHSRGPVQFPKRSGIDRIQATPAQGRQGYVTYTKAIAYFPDDY